MKAWYFSNNNKQLAYGDNRVIRTRLTHKVKCKPILCQQGLHGSKDVLDALNYAPGTYIWRVDLSGDLICILIDDLRSELSSKLKSDLS